MSAASPVGPATPPERPGTASVLLVEDDPDIGHMIERRLAHEGLSTRRAVNGEEALSLAMESIPDVIILDLMLPGMDGYKMARILRQQEGCANVPIVIVSALSHRDNRKRAMKEANACAYLTKPFDFPEMIDAVKRAIGARGGERERTSEANPTTPEPNR